MSDVSCDYADSLLAQLEKAEARARELDEMVAKGTVLLARTQDSRPRRPREAMQESVQLDYDIGRYLQANGFQWDAITRCWRHPQG